MIVFVTTLFSFLFSDYYNHPELNWKNMETENFIICFHQGTERSAGEIATIVEEIHDEVTTLYDFIPDTKTTIIIEDVDDYSNGGAYFFDNKIIISGKPMDYDLRGAHRWLQDVITHEYIHIIQLAASMKYTRKIPGSYIQVLDYEDEKREDVLYGFPNQIISYPIPNTTVPPWFAEGVAQYMYDGANYDYWDSIRDMILRDRVLNNNLLSYDEMNTFGKKGIGNESIYNQGFSLVKYISKKYGQHSLRDITHALSHPLTFSIDKAIKEVLGITGQEIYNDWKIELENIYFSQTFEDRMQNDYIIIEEEGTNNIHPVWSPNQEKFAFLSNKNNDYFGKTDLYIYSFSDSTSEKIESGIKTAPTWINDSLIVYSKKSKPDKYGSKFFDLYSYNIEDEEEEQLTTGLRLFSPFYDVQNKKIYAVNTYDGTCNILVGNEDFSEYEKLSNFNDGTQIFSLYVKDGIVFFDAVINHEREIYQLDSSEKLKDVVMWDMRDPNMSNNVLYSSNDRYGIFNLFKSAESQEGYLTNVSGGAFMPDVSSNDKVIFSIYENGGYKIAILLDDELISSSSVGYQDIQYRSDFNNYGNNYDYYYRPTSSLIDRGAIKDTTDYEIKMSGPFFMPRLMFDNGILKPGLYLFDNDFLNKLNVLTGFSFNKNKDVDAFMLFENNEYMYSYYFNFYFVTRNVSRTHPRISATGEEYVSQKYHVDYTYHLFLADIGNEFMFRDHKFGIMYSFSKYRQFYNVLQTIEPAGMPDEYDYQVGDGAYNYFDGQSLKLSYELDATKEHYLDNMMPRKGFNIKFSTSYEKNNIFEEFRANEQVGIREYLAPHNTGRNELDVSAYWKLADIKDSYLTLSNNFQYLDIINKDVDDFLYYFGGGLPGLKGYSFYDPILQGTNVMLLTNSISYPIFTEKAHKVGFVYLNSLSLSLIHQIGKANSGKIMSYAGSYGNMPTVYLDEFQENQITDNASETFFSYENYVKGLVSEEDAMAYGQPLCHGQFDALDGNDCIPDHLEHYIYPDVYFEYTDWNSPEMLNSRHMSIKDLKYRYKKTKQSIGLSMKLYGFSFYSYPTALTYEYFMPLSDSWNKDGRHYLKLLFDFN